MKSLSRCIVCYNLYMVLEFADDLPPIWHQEICNYHDDVDLAHSGSTAT